MMRGIRAIRVGVLLSGLLTIVAVAGCDCCKNSLWGDSPAPTATKSMAPAQTGSSVQPTGQTNTTYTSSPSGQTNTMYNGSSQYMQQPQRVPGGFN